MWTTLVSSAGSLKEVEAFISSVFQRTNEALVDQTVRGVCNFFGSVSLQQNFEMADQCSVWSQLSFIWQAKENISLRCEGGPTQKKRQGSILAPLFICFFSSS